MPPTLRSFSYVQPEEASLLGAPLLTGSYMDKSLTLQCENLNRAVSRLNLISSHDALLILRHSLSAPKLNYILRAAPCAGHSALNAFDNSLKNAISCIINVDLSPSQWLQASLPVSLGGLGVRSVSMLAPSAFLASAAETKELQDIILSADSDSLDPEFLRIEDIWYTLSNASRSEISVSNLSQKRLDSAVANCLHSEILKTCSSKPVEMARFLAVSAPHAGDWLNALPISSCGLRLDDEAIRIAVGLRLGTRLCVPHLCLCGARVDEFGTHGLSCKQSAGRASRHSFINDLIWRALRKAQVPACREPLGLSRTDGKRPDGVTQIPWSNGKCITWDVTVTDTLAPSHLHTSQSVAGSVAEAAARKKEAKYSCLPSSYDFVPIAIETLGPVNESGIKFLDAIGSRTISITGELRERSYLWQRLSVAVQRFNAVCFRGTFDDQDASQLRSWKLHGDSDDSQAATISRAVIESD